MRKINVLTVAPYPEFEMMMKEVATSFDDIEMSTYTGYYENAIQYTAAFPGKKFDIIISRGGTAELLRELVDIPVIEVEISVMDILRVLIQAQQYHRSFAVISYDYVTSKVDALAQILRIHVPIYTIRTPDDISSAIDACISQGVDVIIGGAATKNHVISAGLQFILIPSSKESMKASITQAINQRRAINNALKNNRIFQSIVDESASAIIIFDSALHVCYTNSSGQRLQSEIPSLTRFLATYIPQLSPHNRAQFMKKFNNSYYNIDGSIIKIDDLTFYSFHLQYLSTNYRPASFITIENFETIQQKVNSFSSNAVYMKPLLSSIHAAASSSLPVLVQGATGTHKLLLSRYIHKISNNPASSFIRIQCKNMTEKTWKALLNNISSPLHSTGYTVLFEDIHELSQELQVSVAAYVDDTNMARRHRLIASSTLDLAICVSDGSFSSKLYQLLNGVTVYIPSLRERKEDIAALANLLIVQISGDLTKPVIGLEPDAVKLLEEYDWPLNLMQLRKVLHQLVSHASSYYICASDVAEVLKSEKRGPAPATASLDLTKSLDEIERQIITQIMQEENNNQTAVAKRLGISRSTLWRKLSV